MPAAGRGGASPGGCDDHRVSTLTLRPMTEPEYAAWRLAVSQAYAEDLVAGGTWAPEDAVPRALRDTDELLPQGPATPGMLLLVGTLDDGTPIGRLWLGLTHPRGVPDCAFVYDIEVDDAHRGAGLGRALLGAAEDAVRSYGARSLELNVFGDDARAIGLYASSGYRVVTQQMRKDLVP